jgi:hypothetical protein
VPITPARSHVLTDLCAICLCSHSPCHFLGPLACSLAAQFGIMLALGTDPVTWYRIKQLVPDIIPRGEAGWKHF